MCSGDNKKNIKLIALDIDGTLFTSEGNIAPSSVNAIHAAQEKGVQIVVASGRNFDGLPWNQLKNLNIQYVITTNGSSVYRVRDRKCLYEECLDFDEARNAVYYILDKKVYITIFMEGDSYSPEECISFVDHMSVPDYIKDLLKGRKNRIFDLDDFFLNQDLKIQKITLNFQSLPNGEFLNRELIKKYLEDNDNFNVVEGGFSNLEFTRSGISKASGLKFLSNYLNISVEEMMAIGDSGNDSDMICLAGLGVAMGNSEDEIKKIADVITSGNDENGISKAIEKYVLS